MIARQSATTLPADRIVGLSPGRPWSVSWARWQQVQTHRVIVRQHEDIERVGLIVLENQPVVLTGDYGVRGHIRKWSLGGGTSGQPITWHPEPINALAFDERGGQHLVAYS